MKLMLEKKQNRLVSDEDRAEDDDEGQEDEEQ
jgi:hypothetical protein